MDSKIYSDKEIEKIASKLKMLGYKKVLKKYSKSRFIKKEIIM